MINGNGWLFNEIDLIGILEFWSAGVLENIKYPPGN